MAKRILVISLGWEQVPLLEKAGELNLDVYGVHYNDDYYKGISYEEILICDVRELDKVLEFAEGGEIIPDRVRRKTPSFDIDFKTLQSFRQGNFMVNHRVYLRSHGF